MPKIRKDIIDKILETAKIEEVITDSLQSYSHDNTSGLKKKGVRYTAICPFHDDRHNGNFIVYPKGNCYKCFVCGAKGGVIDWLMNYERMTYPDAIRYLGKKYSIETDGVDIDYNPPPPRQAPPPLPTLTLPRSMVARRMNTTGDNLVAWITGDIKWGNEQRARIPKVLHDYCVGHSTVQGRHEFTVFWQIDIDGNVRTAHYMKYQRNGHRVKDKQEYGTDWLHSLLSRHWDAEAREFTYDPPYPYPNLYDPDHQEARLCLFGEHLLKRYPKATVKLVESEKTAILMAIAYGNNAKQLWLACCGSSNITRERLKPLINQKRNIILYPDRDGIKAWKQKAEGLYYDRISIDDKPVTDWWQECDGPKADIADVVVRMINQAPPPPTTIEEVRQQVPKLIPLIDNLNLEVK